MEVEGQENLVNKYIFIVSTILLITGCASLKPNKTTNRLDGLEGTLADRVNYQALKIKNDVEFEKDIMKLRKANITLSQLDELATYANDVLERLMLAWGGEKINAKVFIITDSDFQAETLQNHTIFVTLKSFDVFKREDELAAMLAHELSHIYLSHSTKDVMSKSIDLAVKAGEMYLSFNSNKNSPEYYMNLKLLEWSAQKLLFPSWNRHQETEADYLGTDILVKAGYNPKAMASFIKMIGNASQERQAFVAQNMKKSEKKDNTGKTNLAINIDFNSIMNNIRGFLESQFGNDYESAEQRQSDIRNYVKFNYFAVRKPFDKERYRTVLSKIEVQKNLAAYKNALVADELLAKGDLKGASRAGLNSLTGNVAKDPYSRYLMYIIRSKEGNETKAFKNLDIALASKRATLKMYEDIAEGFVSQQKYADALIIIEEANKLFGKPSSILPSTIKATAALGKNTIFLKLKCIKSLDVSLLKACENAEKAYK